MKTLLKLPAWQACLRNHPDADFTHHILTAPRRSAKSSMLSVTQNTTVIEAYLEKEIAASNIIGPLRQDSLHEVSANRFGVIPNKHLDGNLNGV